MKKIKPTLAIFVIVFAIFVVDSQTRKTRYLKSSFRRAKQLDGEGFFGKYRSYEEIQRALRSLKQNFPNKIKTKLLGASSQGRKIHLFSITNSTSKCTFRRKRNLPNVNPENPRLLRFFTRFSNKTKNLVRLRPNGAANVRKRIKSLGKPIIFIDGGSHSREWVSPAAVLYLMNKLAQSDYLTQDIEWKIIPLVNPDGYIHSWRKDRYWRKTLSSTPNSTCSGADINRNFDIFWGEVDTSRNPCAENFGGTASNSEPETMAIIASLTRFRKRTEAYISVHNWGQDILYPYSYTKQRRPTNEEELRLIGQGMADAISAQQSVTYKTGMSSNLLYPASGTALDWAYEALKIPLPYLLELRDDGKQGFQLHEKFIKDTGEDLFLAMEFLAKEIGRKFERIC